MTRHPTSDPRHPSSTVVRLKKIHPCGGDKFTVIRESVVVTLRCQTCDSIVRLPKEKYVKAVIGDR